MKQLRHAAKIVIRRRTDGKYLMLWASEWKENPIRSRQPDLPGGIVEKSETLKEGLAREIQEEAGFTVDESAMILVRTHVWDSGDKSTIFQIYFAEVENPEVTLSWEHERYEWLTAKQVLELEIRDPYPGIFKHMNEIGQLV